MIAWINHCGFQWAAYFGMIVVQNTIFLGLVFLALYMLRNASARIRYTITVIGLMKCFLPPMFPLPILKSIATPQPQITAGSSVAIQPITAVQPTNLSPPPITINIIGLIFLAWILLIAITLMIPLISTLRLKYKLRNSTPVDTPTNLPSQSIQIFKNDFIGMPLTVGLFSKKIFVPADWDHWSPEWQKMVLNHELAHIQRHDSLMKLVQMIAQALYFFHPLIWAVNRKMNELREMACDDRSTSGEMNSSIEYSRYLVEIAETMKQTQLGCTSASALIRQKNELYNRVHYQTREVAMNKNMKRKIALVIGGLLLLYIPLSCYDRSTEPTLDENMESADASAESSLIEIIVTDENNIQVNGEKTTLAECANVIENQLINNENQINKILVKPSDNVSLESYGSIIEEFQRRTFRSDIISAAIDTLGFQGPPPKIDSASQPVDSDQPVFVPYDEAPEPINGYRSIQEKLIYPEKAKTNGIEGRVIIQAQIDKNGDVVQTVIMESVDPACDSSAAEAIKSVKWKPAVSRDVPVAVWIAVPVDFKLRQDEPTTPDESFTPPPPPPSLQEIDENRPVFVEYDEPPEPVGGYRGIQEKIVYPDIAKKAGVEGRVMIQALIDENGNVVNTVVMQSLGSSGYDEAAAEAIKTVEWKPAKRDGVPVKVWIAVPVDFQLQQDEPNQPDESPAPPPPPPPSQINNEETPVFIPYDEPPQPVGGWEAIQHKVVYPDIAHQAGVEGRVIIQTLIDENGDVVNTVVMQSLGAGCDESAAEAIQSVQWEPAIMDGVPVKVWIAVPVEFVR
ncbi:M56 family metallopeptidase [bacterium]|nr:M56 family metallopeptidase [bacterium]